MMAIMEHFKQITSRHTSSTIFKNHRIPTWALNKNSQMSHPASPTPLVIIVNHPLQTPSPNNRKKQTKCICHLWARTYRGQTFERYLWVSRSLEKRSPAVWSTDWSTGFEGVPLAPWGLTNSKERVPFVCLGDIRGGNFGLRRGLSFVECLMFGCRINLMLSFEDVPHSLTKKMVIIPQMYEHFGIHLWSLKSISSYAIGWVRKHPIDALKKPPKRSKRPMTRTMTLLDWSMVWLRSMCLPSLPNIDM